MSLRWILLCVMVAAVAICFTAAFIEGFNLAMAAQ
jgi:hypothetical protein